jgi:hypothetical protein
MPALFQLLELGEDDLDLRSRQKAASRPSVLVMHRADRTRIFINRDPELFAYLQCDKQLADPLMQMIIAIVC